jgi:hypothetical protein
MISENLKKTFLSFLKMVSNGRIISIESIILEYPERNNYFSFAEMTNGKVKYYEYYSMVTIKVTSVHPIYTDELIDIGHKFRSTFKPQLHDCGIKINCDMESDYFC